MMTKLTLKTPLKKSNIFFVDKYYEIKDKNTILVVDNNTDRLTKNIVYNGCKIVIPAGDKSKSFKYVQQIINTAIENKLDRNATFYALGGGMVCDITAFCASIFKRGVKLTLIPTSLLAMVDASIGGKTAINSENEKNMIGSFYPADNIFICFDFLNTLPRKEFKSGFAEIFKIGLINCKEIFKLIIDNKNNNLFTVSELMKKLIELSIKSKIKIVERDTFENNQRKYLNLGHTFGHALESLTDFSFFSHGEAVAWGIAQSMKFGNSVNITNSQYAKNVIDLLNYFEYETKSISPALLTKFNLDKNKYIKNILKPMLQDKKNNNNHINLIIQKKLNANIILQTDIKEIESFFYERLQNE